MPTPPLPNPSGDQHCFACGQPLTGASEFCPRCGQRLYSQKAGCSNFLTVFLFILGAVVFGGLGACMMTASGVAGGTGSSLQDFLMGLPGFVIALLFIIAAIKSANR